MYRQPTGVGIVLFGDGLNLGQQLFHCLFDGRRISDLLVGNRLVLCSSKDCLFQFRHPLPAGGDDGNDRTTQAARQAINVDFITSLLGHVHHVQGDQHRSLHLQ